MLVKSIDLKKCVRKAICGAGFKTHQPLTGMIGLKSDIKNNVIEICTTDMVNRVWVHCPALFNTEEVEEFSVTVDADKFSKLVSKIVCDEVEINVDKSLNIVADGKYKIGLVSDEEGLVSFPQFSDVPSGFSDEVSISMSNVLSAFKVGKTSLASLNTEPMYTGYYVDKDCCVSTDTHVVTINEVPVLGDGLKEPHLIPDKLMSLLAQNDEKQVKFSYNKDSKEFCFKSNLMTIVGPELDGIEDFPIDKIKPYLYEKYKSSCEVFKDFLIEALDRLSLFVEPYEERKVEVEFVRTGIVLRSLTGTGTEVIRYQGHILKEEDLGFKCTIDGNLFKTNLASFPYDRLEVHFGDKVSLKVAQGQVTQVIAFKR